MTERASKCFKCGEEGHIARACPQGKSLLTQPTTPATTAANPATSPGTAPKLKRKATDLKDGRTTTTTTVVLISSASIAAATAIWPVNALRVR